MARSLHTPLASLLLATLWACGGGQAPEPPPPDTGSFSAAQAWSELEMLSALAPRTSGSDGALAARRRIRERLEALAIPVETLETTATPRGGEPVQLTHLVATLPGASGDRFVLMAPYDSGRYEEFEFVGANDGASGAAVLLELARVLARRDFPYTLQFVWLEGEGRLGLGDEGLRERRWLGSTSLAERWNEEGRLDDIRLLLVLNRVCDADLSIARDLGSHRTHREQIWRVARKLGYSGEFDRDTGYQSVNSSHDAFRNRGVRPVVAIEDTAFGGDEPPGAHAGAGDLPEHCAAESLEIVGRVALAGLEQLGARLAKIDRFSELPSVPPEETEQESEQESAEGDPESGGASADGAAEPEPPTSESAAP